MIAAASVDGPAPKQLLLEPVITKPPVSHTCAALAVVVPIVATTAESLSSIEVATTVIAATPAEQLHSCTQPIEVEL